MIKRILLVLALSLSIGALPVLAAPNFISSDSGVVSVTTPIFDDAYVAGGQVIIDRDVDGDLFIGGGNVDVVGNVAGDLMIGAGTVTVSGNVGDDIRIGGGQVQIKGTVGDDVLVGAGLLLVDSTAVIRGDLVAGSGSFHLNGRVAGNLKASFSEGVISGTVDGDASLRYEDKLSFGDDSRIAGKLTYWASSEDPAFESFAGSVEYHKWTARPDTATLGALALLLPTITLGAVIWKFLAMLLLGGLIILLMPKWLPWMIEATKKDYGTTLWQGVLFLVLTPILGMLALVTLIGLPVAVVLGLVYALAICLSGIVVSALMGSYIVKLDKSKSKLFGALAIGSAIYVLLTLLPIIGWLIKLVLVIVGLGALWRHMHSLIRSAR